MYFASCGPGFKVQAQFKSKLQVQVELSRCLKLLVVLVVVVLLVVVLLVVEVQKLPDQSRCQCSATMTACDSSLSSSELTGRLQVQLTSLTLAACTRLVVRVTVTVQSVLQ
jgi:hypothetical protein